MSGDYIIRWNNGPGHEEVILAASLDRAVLEIESFADLGGELIYVLAVDQIDGRWIASDITDSVIERLSERETARLVDQFLGGGHNFHSLAGYLEMADRVWPMKKRAA